MKEILEIIGLSVLISLLVGNSDPFFKKKKVEIEKNHQEFLELMKNATQNEESDQILGFCPSPVPVKEYREESTIEIGNW